MDRRLFIVVAAGGLVASLPKVRAQPARNAYRIGYLRQGAVPIAEPFWARMNELGWFEGRNVTIEPRYGGREQLRELAAELVRSKVDLILTNSTPASLAAKEATATIPIVFVVGADPVARGLVASLARPGGNLTGYAIGLYEEKMLDTLKAALPGSSRVALPAGGPPFPDTERAARELGLELLEVEGLSPDRFDLFLANARKAGADALFIPNIAWLSESLARLGRAATSARLPAIAAEQEFCEGRRPACLWSHAGAVLAAHRRPGRQDPARRQARGSAGRTADPVHPGGQSQGREGARHRDSAIAVAKRR